MTAQVLAPARASAHGTSRAARPQTAERWSSGQAIGFIGLVCAAFWTVAFSLF